jgi:hypothetical protein
MLVGLPCADDVNRSVVRSGVNNSVHGGLNVPERHVPKLAVVLTIIDRFDDFILEDQGSPQERNLVILDVGSVLVFMPRELQHLHLVIFMYTFVYTYQGFPQCPTKRLIVRPDPTTRIVPFNERERACRRGRRDGRNLAPVDAATQYNRWTLNATSAKRPIIREQTLAVAAAEPQPTHRP